mmetsp:Transcript_25619/g.36750  ORF Transcript_25619/g.36750 Transcript_25619/m.36750 type:complete len:336 (+) Transcript_25619:3-1010(+)
MSMGSNASPMVEKVSSEVLNRLNEYLSMRPTEIIEVAEPIKISKVPKKSEAPAGYDFLAMFKPSGWYKDAVALDLEARSDKRVPRTLHPLSFIELKKYGYEDLSPIIMELGGPYVVSDLIGFDWKEPELPQEVWDEDLRPRREEFYALDFRGSLLLGGALEDRLSLAENLDLEDLKSQIAEVARSNSSNLNSNFKDNANFIYNSSPRKSKSTNSDSLIEEMDKMDSTERFNLLPNQRIYLVTLTAMFALGFGHASQDFHSILMDINPKSADVVQYVSDAAKVLSIVLITSSAISAGLSLQLSQNLFRKQELWFLKSLLSGPTALSQLKSLPPLRN